MGRGKGIIYLFTAVLLAGVLLCAAVTPRQEPGFPLSLVTEAGETIQPWEQEAGRYVFFLPGYADLSQTRLRIRDASLSLNGQPLTDGEDCGIFQWDQEHTLTLSSPAGETRVGITLLRSSPLPSLHIDTQSGSMEYILMEKGNQEPGTMRLYDANGSLSCQGQLDSLNGRGNVTWKLAEKKSYSMTLTRETDLLEMGAAKKWILLSDIFDPSHLRNKLVYDFASEMGLAFSPESRWVDLYLNGDYAGLYLLTERNEVHPQRVNLSGEDSFLVSAELASRLDSQNYDYITTPSGIALRIHHSSLFTEELETIWASAEGAILASDGVDSASGKHWTERIDLDSWAKKYLMEELFGNVDSTISQFYYYDAASGGGKIFAGPVWDYDSSMGFYIPTVLFADKPGTWYHALCQKAEFRERVISLYETSFRPRLEAILEEELEVYASLLRQACQSDQRRWNTEPAEGNTQTLYYYMKERIAFLDSLWLEEEAYCTVLADWASGSGAVCYAVRPGEVLTALPEGYRWVCQETETPFDPGQPIWEDLEIRAVSGEEQAAEEPLSKLHLLPCAAAAALLLLLGAADFLQRKRETGADPGKMPCSQGKGVL